MSANLKLELVNYKTIESAEVDLTGYDVVIFQGDNRVGKSSVINGILENFLAKQMSNAPLTKGEKEGEKKIETIDVYGNPITIIHNFSKERPTGSFWASQNGRPIRNVTEIRALLGEVNELTVDELFQMCKSTDGRRKFIKKFLYQGLSEDNFNSLENIELKIKPRTGSLVSERTILVTQKETYESLLKSSLTEEEVELINNEARMRSVAASKIEELKELEKSKSLSERRLTALSEFMTFHNVAKWIVPLESIREQMESEFKLEMSKYTELGEFVENKINPKMKNLDVAVNKNNQITHIRKQLEGVNTRIDKINSDIDTLKERKNQILKNIKLPEGVVIHSESDFSINGLDFSQTDISESEAWMLLAELSIKQFSAKYMRMGSASVYNRENLNKLAVMARENGKIIALERVIDEQKDIKVIGIVADDLSQHEIDAMFTPYKRDNSNAVDETPAEEKKTVVQPVKENMGNDEPKEIENLF